jgi:hypothetical protein
MGGKKRSKLRSDVRRPRRRFFPMILVHMVIGNIVAGDTVHVSSVLYERTTHYAYYCATS